MVIADLDLDLQSFFNTLGVGGVWAGPKAEPLGDGRGGRKDGAGSLVCE